VVFTLQRDGREILARGGYSFPFESRHNGRLPMSLSVAVPLGLEATELSACWEVYGAGLTARIDSHSTLVAIVGGSGEMTASPAVGWESSERSVSRSAPARTAPSEVSIPFLPGYVARVRYDGSGGGALNIHSGKHIALHVNPRPHEALVLNSFLRGAWGPEERPGGFPLAGSGEVTLTVWAGPDAFFIQATEAALKAPFVYRYNYRLPPGRKLDRVTTDLAGLREFSVRPEL
jgi:hypothetical protein